MIIHIYSDRAPAIDFLPGLGSETPAVSITSQDLLGRTNFGLYLSPFSKDLWLLLMGIKFNFKARCPQESNHFGCKLFSASAFLMGALLTAAVWYQSGCGRVGSLLRAFPRNVWLVFASNFGIDMGGKGSSVLSSTIAEIGINSVNINVSWKKNTYSPKDDLTTSIRLLLLGVFITGNVVFMGYRASLTSELSVHFARLPFRDLESLADSDFK